MHTVVVNRTFLEVEELHGAPTPQPLRQRALRSQTTSDMGKYEGPVDGNHTHYVHDGLGWCKTEEAAPMTTSRTARSSVWLMAERTAEGEGRGRCLSSVNEEATRGGPSAENDDEQPASFSRSCSGSSDGPSMPLSDEGKMIGMSSVLTQASVGSQSTAPPWTTVSRSTTASEEDADEDEADEGCWEVGGQGKKARSRAQRAKRTEKRRLQRRADRAARSGAATAATPNTATSGEPPAMPSVYGVMAHPVGLPPWVAAMQPFPVAFAWDGIAAPVAVHGAAGTPLAAPAVAPPCPAGSGPASGPSTATGQTTVMLRNLPNNYTRSMLLELLDSEGFAGTYDFLYLPHDFRTEAGLGYAFVNFVTPADAENARRHLEGFRRWAIPSGKVCSVSWSDPGQQGLEANINRYRNSSVMHPSVREEVKPLVFEGGKPAPFPQNTRKLWPPHESYGIRARGQKP